MTQGMTLSEFRSSSKMHKKESSKALVPHLGSGVRVAKKTNIITQKVVLDADKCWVIPADLFKTGESRCYNLNYRDRNVGHINYGTCRIEMVIKDPAISIKIEKEIRTGYLAIDSAGKVTLASKITSDYFAIEAGDIVFREAVKSDFLIVKAIHGFTNFKSLTIREDVDIIAGYHMSLGDIKSKNIIINTSSTLTNFSVIKPSKKIILTAKTFKNYGTLEFKLRLELAVTRFENTATGNVSVDSISNINTSEIIQQGHFSVARPTHFKTYEFANHGHTELPLGTIVEADSLFLKKSSVFTCAKPESRKKPDFSVASYLLTQVILNKQVVIDEGACIHLANCLLQAPKIELAGTLNVSGMILNCNELYQNGGVSKFDKSQIYVTKVLMAKLGASSEFLESSILADQIDSAAKFTFSSSYLKSRLTSQKGLCKFDKSYVVVSEFATHLGGLTDSYESKIENLNFDLSGKYQFIRSNISSETMKIKGEMRGQKSQITTERFEFPQGFIEIKETSLSAKENLDLLGRSELQEAVLEGLDISAGGKLGIKNSTLNAKRVLSTKPGSEIHVDATLFRSGVTLHLAGHVKADAKSTLRAKYIKQDGDLSLSSSAMIADSSLAMSSSAVLRASTGSLVKSGIGTLSGSAYLDKSLLQSDKFEFSKKVVLTESKLEATERLIISKGTEVDFSYSEIKAAYIINKGKFSVQRSHIFGDRLRNEDAKIQLNRTSIELSSELSDSSMARWEMDEGVVIKAKHVTLNGKSLMSKSFIVTPGSFWQFGKMEGTKNRIEALEIFTGSDSQTSATQSHIEAKYAELNGHTQLTKRTTVLSDLLTLPQGGIHLNESSLQIHRSVITSPGSSVQLDMQSALISKVGIFDGSLNAYKKSNVKLTDAAILRGSTYLSDSLLESDAVYFTGDKQHQLNQSQIKSKTLYCDVQLKATGKSLLQADSSWVVGKNGAVILEDSGSKTDGDFSVLGKASFLRSALEAREALIYGDLEVAKSQFTIANKFEIKSTSKTKLSEQSLIKAKVMHLAGDTQVDTSFLKAEQKLTIMKDFSASKSRLEAESADLEGNLRLQESLLKTEMDITLHDDLRMDSDKAHLEAGRQILVSRGARVTGKGLALKADLLSNYGSISTEEYLAVDVERLWNQFAVLKSDGTTKIEANKFFFNLLGHVGGVNTSITAGTSLNLFGDICGSDNLDINTLFALNFLGTHRSWNANINSLLNLNMGLVAPLTTPSSWSSVLSAQRLLSLSRMMLNSTFPIYSNSINLAYTAIPMIPSVASAAWQGTQTLFNSVVNWDFSPIKKSWDDIQEQISNAKLKDILPVILKTKNLVMAGLGLYQTAHKAHGEYSQHYTWDQLHESMSGIDVDSLGWKSLEHMGTVLGPMYSSSSVFNLNLGFVGALNASEMDLLGMNYGTKMAGQSWVHTSNVVFNQGLYQSVLGSTTLTGSQLSGGGTILGEGGLNLIFDAIHCDKGALCRGQNIYVKADELSIDSDARAEFKKGLFELRGALCVKQNGTFSAEEVQFNAESVDTQGRVHFEKSCANVRGIIRSSEGGEFTSLNGLLTARDLIAGTYGLVKLKSESEKQKTASDSSADQRTVDLSGQLIVEENGKLITECVTVSAQGAITHGSANFDKVALHLRDKLTVERTGTIKGQEMRLAAAGIDVRGQADFKASSIDLKEKLKVEQDGVFSAKESQFRAQGIDTQGHAHFEKSSVELRGDIHASQGGEFSSLDGSVIAKDLIAGFKGAVKLINDPPPNVEKPASGKEKEDIEASKRPLDVDLSGEIMVDESGALIMQNVLVSAEKAHLNGKVDSEQVQLQTKDKLVFSKTAHLKTKDSEFSSRVTEYYGNTDYRGYLIFKSQNLVASQESHMIFDKSSDQPGYLYLEADRGVLYGRVDADHAMVKVKELASVDDFVMRRGKYSQFNVSDSLGLDTDAHISLDQSILRKCGLDLSGLSIRFNTEYQTAHDIRLTSRQSDISILKDITSKNIYTNSAAATYTSSKITAAHDAFFRSKGVHYNLGGELSGQVVLCEAADIKNITRGSEAFKKLARGLKKIMGDSGAIYGSEVYLNATTGNIENYGGVIEGYQFLQGLAKANILNICNERVRKGKYDYIKEYDPAAMLGGTGLDDERIGMYLQCDGKLINDASTIWSNGHTHVVAEGGVESSARYHTYVAGKEKDRTWYGKKKEKEWTESVVQKANFGSTGGRVQILCKKGGFYGVGTDFIAKGGTDIFTRDKVVLYSLTVENTVTKKKEHLWGLNKSKRKERHQGVFTSDFIDDGTTRLHSLEGDVILRGVRVVGNGHFDVKAKGKIHFSADVLSHHVSEKRQGFSVSSGLFDFGKKIAHGDVKGLLAMNPTYAGIKGLFQSHGVLDRSKNAYDVYQNLNDTYRLFSSGIESGLMGYAAGFNPSLGISYGVSQSDHFYETLGSAGIARGSCSFEAGESVTLQGLPVSVNGDMFVKAKDFQQIGQKLKSHSKAESYSVGVAVSAAGEIGEVNASYSKSKSSSTHYQHQDLQVGGRLHVDVDRWTLDAANTEAGQLTGEVREKLTMISRQDIIKSQSMSASANSSGQMSLSMQQHSSKRVDKMTGIHVKDRINHDASHQLKVKVLASTGAEILTDGVNKFQAESAIHHRLKDHSKTRGFSLSGNVAEITKVLSASDEPMKATVKLGLERTDQRAQVQSTLHGKQGTEIKVAKQHGKAHTASDDSYRVTKNSHHSLKVSVPIINKAGIKQEIEKVKNGLSKVKNVVTDVLGIKEKAAPSMEVNPMSAATATQISVSDESSPEMPESVASSQTAEPSQASAEASAKIYDDIPELIDEEDLPTAKQLQQQQIQTVLEVTDYVSSYAAEAADAYFHANGVPVAGKIMHALSVPITFAANLHKEQSGGNPSAMSDAFADTLSEFTVEYAIPAPVVAAARVGQWSRDVMTEAMYDPDFVNLGEDSQEVRWECYGAASAWGAVGDALDWVEGRVGDMLKYRKESHKDVDSMKKNGIFKSKSPMHSPLSLFESVQYGSAR